jgi:hypothetical protein
VSRELRVEERDDALLEGRGVLSSMWLIAPVQRAGAEPHAGERLDVLQQAVAVLRA